MQRSLSFAIHANQDRLVCLLTDCVESQILHYGTDQFRPLAHHCDFYEYLRSTTTGRIVGVEMHLSNEVYDEWLAGLPGFERLPPFTPMVRRWQLWFHKEPAEIRWEQILSQNPYRSDDGEILILLQACHLGDAEFEDLYETTLRFSTPGSGEVHSTLY